MTKGSELKFEFELELVDGAGAVATAVTRAACSMQTMFIRSAGKVLPVVAIIFAGD